MWTNWTSGVHTVFFEGCDAAGLSNMQLQGAVSIFAVNLKRILKLKGEVCPNEEK